MPARPRHAALGLLAATATLALGACGSSDSEPATTAAGTSSDAAGKSIKVGVLIPGSIKDAGFMQSAYEGVERAKKTYAGKADISYVEQVGGADMQQALTQLASKSDLVVSIGGQTDEALRKVTPTFPDTSFVEVGGPPEAGGNLAAYDPKQAEIAYVAGVSAALLSKSGAVQFVAGVEIPPIVNTAKEFARGAKAADPSVKVLAPAYTGDFDDVSKAKEAALSGIAQGADVQYQILNLGLKGLQQAAQEKGTKLIGGPLPQKCGSQPEFAAYTKSDIGAATEYAIDQKLKGTFKGEYTPFGLASDTDASAMLLCEGGQKVQDKVTAVEEKIRSGKVKTI